METLLSYDGSFTGLLTSIFEVYERKLDVVRIQKNANQKNVFDGFLFVVSDEIKAKRVWDGLQKKLSIGTMHNFYACFLSEEQGIEVLLLQFCQYVFSTNGIVEKDFSHDAVLALSKLARKVFREKHRMEAFVRFQRLADDVYFSIVEPDFNVLPLIINHFASRYADQRWIIYDQKRNFGIAFNPELQSVDEIKLDFIHSHHRNQKDILHIDELNYQALWKSYFQNVNIPSRKNMKLHIQHVPSRYWKHLTEKEL
jgi:probable DNA metabolism protein